MQTVARDRISRGLLWLTMVSGYMNAILRTSPESQVTLFRLVLPFALVVLFFRQPFRASTRWAIRWVLLLVVYSVVQIVVFRLGGDTLIWSYLVNLVAARGTLRRHASQCYSGVRRNGSLLHTPATSARWHCPLLNACVLNRQHTTRAGPT